MDIDDDLVHDEIKKFNHKRIQQNTPLMNEDASKIWKYPQNLLRKQYILNASKSSLLINQLICLPMGMDRTLIATVVIYNFYRWYPKGIIVYMCPRRALLEQQMNACYDFLDIPQEHYADLNGRMTPIKRKKLWNIHRLFFVSPVTLNSDLQRDNVPIDKFVCIVIEEAFLNLQYKMIRDILKINNNNIRILVLTSTLPGRIHDIKQKLVDDSIQQLIDDLKLTDMMIKYVDDTHSFNNEIQTILCPLTNNLKEIKNKLEGWIDKQLDELFRYKAIGGFAANTITSWNIQNECSIFLKTNQQCQSTKWFCRAIFDSLQKLVTLREKLEMYSVDVMMSKLEQITDNVGKQPQAHHVIYTLLQEIEFAEWKSLCRQEIESNELHPKIKKLRQILQEQFKNMDEKLNDSKVIIFSSLRYSVTDIVNHLSKFEYCRPYQFVGPLSHKLQKGLTNNQQKQVINDFKSGKYNILVSTRIGEENEDIGEVDIVIHYDMATDVLRNVQRNSKTGRKRTGRVIYLWSTTIEMEKYKTINVTQNHLGKIDKSKYNFSQNASRMFPNGYNPSLKIIRTAPAVFGQHKCLLNDDLENEFDDENINDDTLNISDKYWCQYPNMLKCTSCLHFNFETVKCNKDIILQLLSVNNNFMSVPSIDTSSKDLCEWIINHRLIKGFCDNCWLTLLPHLKILLKHIYHYTLKYNQQCIDLKDKRNMNKIAIQFINSETALSHFEFINKLINHIITIKYVFQHPKLSKYIYNYWWVLLKLMLCTDLMRKRPQELLILTTFQHAITDGFFLKTFVFWSNKHQKHLRNIARLIMFFVIENLKNNWDDLSLTHFYIVRVLALLKSKCNVMKNDILWNKLRVNKCITDICWLHSVGYLNQKAPELKNCIIDNSDDIEHVINKYFPAQDRMSKVITPYLLALIAENKYDETRCLGIFSVIEYKYNLKCCSPKCKVTKYQKYLRNASKYLQGKTDATLAKLNQFERKFIKYKMWKCKGCKIAVYCSRSCQKMHWNKYGHKQQCIDLSSSN